MKPATDLASILARQGHLETEVRNYRAALELIRDRQFTADRVYQSVGMRTAGEIAQAALDGTLFARVDRTNLT